MKPHAAVTADFKKAASRSILSIIAFILVYCILFAASLALSALSFYAGIWTIAAKPGLWTLIIGLGLMAAGVLVVVFLVKFLFSRQESQVKDSFLITEEDHPELVKLIHELAEACGTLKPKKIFLSPDVNACVFYDSSFFSMFLPVKKNLKIGLGLVNAVNVSELKAVIAHEFGHFSQRSMKVGSWVYQVNKIIYDMLYNNKGFGDSINAMSRLHGILSFFMMLTVQVIKAVQWVLSKMFALVNLAYHDLSRQMEFHADLVAATVCGSNNIIHALRRSEFADVAMSTVIEVANAAWKEQKKLEDIYSGQSFVIKEMAVKGELQLEAGLPVLQDADHPAMGSRVNFKDQWASHPTLEERKKYLDQFQLEGPVEEASAWSLFNNQEMWKQKLSEHMYRDAVETAETGHAGGEEFRKIYHELYSLYSLPAVFRNYYDLRLVEAFDTSALTAQPFRKTKFHEVLDEKGFDLPRRIFFLKHDIQLMQSIVSGDIKIASFDFDGNRYKRKEAKNILANLEQELADAEKQLVELDREVFLCCYANGSFEEAELLKKKWKTYFEERALQEKSVILYREILDLLAPLYSGNNMTLEQVTPLIDQIKEKELQLKADLRSWGAKGIFESDENLRSQVEKFLESDYAYFHVDRFFDNELNHLQQVIIEGSGRLDKYIWQHFYNCVSLQAGILEKGIEATPAG